MQPSSLCAVIRLTVLLMLIVPSRPPDDGTKVPRSVGSLKPYAHILPNGSTDVKAKPLAVTVPVVPPAMLWNSSVPSVASVKVSVHLVNVAWAVMPPVTVELPLVTGPAMVDSVHVEIVVPKIGSRSLELVSLTRLSVRVWPFAHAQAVPPQPVPMSVSHSTLAEALVAPANAVKAMAATAASPSILRYFII